MAKDPAIEERDRAMRERWKASMEADFNPNYTPERTPKAEDRMVNAVEYAAYQLGQINKRLGHLSELMEQAAAKK